MENENEWDKYGVDKEQWDTFTDEEKEAYRGVGRTPNSGEE